MAAYNTVKLLKHLSFALIFVRFITLPFNIITDNTEARYAEIGRKMFITGDFITPFIEFGVPFWAKPPLSFWGTATSYFIFGVNQFAAHLPHFLFLLAVVGMVYLFVKKHFDILTAWTSVLVLLSSSFFLYLMGGVMTDPALTFTTTLALYSFYNAMSSETRVKFWGYMFYVGLALSLLAKGPLGLVLVGLTTLLWCILKGKIREAFRRIPWVTGTILMLIIALPWYILAEIKTPGFLEYFIIGEHFHRYTEANWSGDLYGEGRGGVRGIIFAYFLLGIFPWSIYILGKMFNKDFRAIVLSKSFIKNEKILYLLLWCLSPLIFFSFSRNVISPYVLPMLPSAAIVVAYLLCKSDEKLKTKKFVIVSGVNIVLLITIAILPYVCRDFFIRSDKFIVEEYQAAKEDNEPLVYLGVRVRYSTEFYSQDTIERISSVEELDPYLQKSKNVFVFADDDVVENSFLWKKLDINPVFRYKDKMLLKVTEKK